METSGNIVSVAKDIKTGKFNITFSVSALSLAELETYQNEELTISFGKQKKKRSKDANAMLWMMLGKLAAADNSTNWDKYLEMLKKYGTYTYIVVIPKAVESVKAQWRESEVIGNINVNGREAVQMLCYYGSSTMDVHEFKRLLDGVIEECRAVGIETPQEFDKMNALIQWEQEHGKHSTNK